MENKVITWAICDDVESIRFSYQMSLKKYKDISCIGECADGKELMALFQEKKPDVLILDIQLEYEKEGLDLIEKIKEKSPNTKILILTSYDNDEYIFEAFASGADGYIKKDEPMENMYNNIVNVYNSKISVPNDIAKTLASEAKKIRTEQKSYLFMMELLSRLTASEIDILKEFCSGKSAKEIAKLRVVDMSTVRVQAYKIIKKFNAKSMKALVKDLNELHVFEIFDRK